MVGAWIPLLRCFTQSVIKRNTFRIPYISAVDIRVSNPGIRTLCSEADVMDLRRICKELRALADPTLAGSWDNVGLLIEPTPPHTVNRMLLTNDLTETVMEEAVDKKVDMILSYHPPIFASLKRLTQSKWKERIVIRCIENRIALYSPHTAFDAVPGGVNDWLLTPFRGTISNIESCQSKCYPQGGAYRLEFICDLAEAKSIEGEIKSVNNINMIFKTESEETIRYGYNCSEKGLPKVIEIINRTEMSKATMEIFKGEKPPLPNTGAGRLCCLTKSVTIQEAVNLVKAHLNLKHIRLALGVGASTGSEIKKIAVCAGSGASVLSGVDASLYITGEMSHHEVLDANHRGVSVILCDHSNTERGYLQLVKNKLENQFGDNKVEIFISDVDKDPLVVV